LFEELVFGMGTNKHEVYLSAEFELERPNREDATLD
jgi:hypothetical protein